MSRARIRVTFLSSEQGGRASPLVIGAHYRPHLCVSEGDYLGVVFEEPADFLVTPGVPIEAVVRFVYEPQVDYSSLSAGAFFEVREGAKSVGTGIVQEVE